MRFQTNMRLRTLFAATAASLALSACGGGGKLPSVSSASETRALIPDSPVKLGAAYNINGVQYVPADTANYDAVGHASWYGEERSGQTTANGETFNAAWVSGSHKTLPLPSYVEVTSLETGRTILVRINDRGPMSNDRLIDLSEGAAKQLGITNSGTSAVRVRRVNPPQGERDVLRSGGQASPRLDTPPSLLTALNKKLDGQKGPVTLGGPSVVAATPPTAAAPKPVTAAKPVAAPKPVAAVPKPAQTPVPAPRTDDGFIVENVGSSRGRTTTSPTPTPAAASRPAVSRVYYVQVASFSSEARASAAAKKAGASVEKSGSLYRVRSGPYASEEEANRALVGARKAGFGDARVFSETR